MFKLQFLALSLIVALPLILGKWANPVMQENSQCPVPPDFLEDTLLYDGYNELFAASGACVQCHGFDTAMLASVDILGNDINLVDDWRPTMMANSARDPLWRAKVSHEVLVNPAHQETLEDKCTACHAPLGHFNAHHVGLENYSMADLENDPMGQDGVSCLSCHQQVAEGLGANHSGELHFDTAQVAYGPYISPLATPMVLESGWLPVYSEHTADAGLCAGCHTLITETVDLEGNFTGETFVEQATYHEWLNSTYNEDDVSCQSCHMPAVTKSPVLIAAGYTTAPRTPFYLHDLVGGNTFMLELMKANKETLGIPATDEQYDETISKTYEMLQGLSLQLELEPIDRTIDTVYFDVELSNMAGHKFPSGYPARRLFLEVVVKTESGTVLFHSGKMDGEYELSQQDATFEPHYDRITDENQVQIYELVLGDVNGDVTTVLERAAIPLKDNRLTPIGFTTSHEVYDTTQLAGAVLTDANFNYKDGIEGSGTDLIHFAVPNQNVTEELIVEVMVHYQSVPKRWLEEMFQYSSPQIDAFKGMYEAADRSPVLIRQAITNFGGLTALEDIKTSSNDWMVQPTISSTGHFEFVHPNDGYLEVFDKSGKRMLELPQQAGNQSLQLDLPAGIYILRYSTETEIYAQRIVVQ